MTSLAFPSDKPQRLDNHRAIDPGFIAVALLLFVLVGMGIFQMVKTPSLGALIQAVLALIVLYVHVKARTNATKVQTRVVRLEMALRLRELLDEKAAAEAREKLTIAQIVALRFASDEELPALLRRAIDEKLTATQIKREVKVWQGDWFRV